MRPLLNRTALTCWKMYFSLEIDERTWYNLNRWITWAKEVPWLLEDVALEDYPDLQFNTRCWHLERTWFDNLAGNMKKTQWQFKKKKFKKGLLQWPSGKVLECQKARVYHPWSSSDVKCSLGPGRLRKVVWGWGKERFFRELHEAVSGGRKRARGYGWCLWCGCRAERKWPSQPVITAAVVGPSLTARRWQRTQEAGCPSH